MADSFTYGDGDIAHAHEILRVVAGSESTGMAIPGSSDRDEMAIYIEIPEQLLGLESSSDHYTEKTAEPGVRSTWSDKDSVSYSFRKFMKLATDGNPSILTLLFASNELVIRDSVWADQLRKLTPSIVSLQAGYRHLGYLDGQRERMDGRGSRRRVPNRPELIDAYGYDTKYASHALRLGYQGIEIITKGALALPMDREPLEACMKVKRGEVGFLTALKMVDNVRDELAALLVSKPTIIRPKPDMETVNIGMVQITHSYWNETFGFWRTQLG